MRLFGRPLTIFLVAAFYALGGIFIFLFYLYYLYIDIFMVIGLAEIIIAYGLWNFKKWAGILGLILSLSNIIVNVFIDTNNGKSLVESLLGYDTWIISIILIILFWNNLEPRSSKNISSKPIKSPPANWYESLDFIFGNEGGWQKTLIICIFLGVGIKSLLSYNLSEFESKYEVAFIGYPVWWITRNRYWNHRHDQIINLLSAKIENIDSHLNSLFENKNDLYNEIREDFPMLPQFFC